MFHLLLFLPFIKKQKYHQNIYMINIVIGRTISQMGYWLWIFVQLLYHLSLFSPCINIVLERSEGEFGRSTYNLT